MLLQKLTLRNFLSYQQATLNFQGMHVACICGANGAGKSSLLEAITWAIWGKSRAPSEDDVIHQGAVETQVDVVFLSQGHTYRIVRSRRRTQGTALDFQVATPTGFRPLSQRTVKATQGVIEAQIKLDYDTFVNSAYLRQGQADDFMKKRPTERKQVLADLLRLDQYDLLAEQARERGREAKALVDQAERTLADLDQQLATEPQIQADLTALMAEQEGVQRQLQVLLAQQQTLKAQQQQRQVWLEQQTWYHQQTSALQADRQRLLSQQQQIQARLSHGEALLNQAEAIAQAFQTWQSLQAQEAAAGRRWQAVQTLQAERQALQTQLTETLAHLERQLQQVATEQSLLQEQRAKLAPLLGEAETIAQGYEHLQQARAALQDWEGRQAEAAPLQQRQRELQTQQQQAQARLQARLEELTRQVDHQACQLAGRPQFVAQLALVSAELTRIEKLQVYLQQVQEKGQERRHFLERLETSRQEYEHQLAQLAQKAALLQQPEATCPLCNQPLDAHHWQQVHQQHQDQEGQLRDYLWLTQEQQAVTHKEITLLREEYRHLRGQIEGQAQHLQHQGQLQQQLAALDELAAGREAFLQERDRCQAQLASGHYAPPIQAELETLTAALSALAYDDKAHALARSAVERWHWADIKQAQLRQAQSHAEDIDRRLPHLAERFHDLHTERTHLQTDAPEQQRIHQIDQALGELNYDPEAHQALRQAIQQQQDAAGRYQELQVVQAQHPQIQTQHQELVTALAAVAGRQAELSQALESVTQALAQTPDPGVALADLDQRLHRHRQTLDQSLAQQGRLEQQLQHLASLKQTRVAQQAQLNHQRHQARLYQELSHAFGKHGIQTLMIENLLPQLEATANYHLGQLSNHQLHVQFITQKAARSAPRKQERLIETLEIHIADAQGTRPYETYSGGEAFRVNFALRLALARVLAQRSGATLQMLIVDEGFGTQDQEGCERLVAAINAIAADFACILMVTHMPTLKEAFQTRLEVTKTE